jgi:hypothetical protein
MSSKTPKSTSTTTQQVFSPEETAARNQLFQAGQTAFDQQNAAFQNAGNPAAKPIGPSSDTLAAQNMIRNFATGAGQGTADNIAGAVNYGLTGAMDVNNNPHLAGAIDAAIRPMVRNFSDPGGALSQIRSSSIANGQFGGTRQGIAEGIAASRLATDIGDVSARMSSDAYNKGQDTFARTLGLAPSAMQAGLMPANMLSAIGAQNEGFSQMLENYNAAGREFDLNRSFIPVQNYANLINGIQAPSTTSTNSVNQGGAGTAMSALGGGVSGAMMGAPLGPVGMAVGGGLGVLMGLF